MRTVEEEVVDGLDRETAGTKRRRNECLGMKKPVERS
jgi:hypothetical protein